MYLAGAIERSSMLQRGKRFKTLSSIGITRILALTATKLSQLKHRFEANTYHDMKLKKLARRIKNIYDLDCYPRQEESDRRVKYNGTTWTTVLLLDQNYSTTAVLL